MKKSSLFVLCFLSLVVPCVAQNLASHFQSMKNAYASSGNIVVLDDHTILIEPKMPGPLCATPTIKDGKTTWVYYTFPLASIVVPLASIDETLIAEDHVFTDPDAAKSYKPGDVGDTTMVAIAGVTGKQFHTITYDRDKFTHLGPGPHSAVSYGQTTDDTEAFALTFSDHAAAREFEVALKEAVIVAKAQANAQAKERASIK
jgi:hypothetical protein